MRRALAVLALSAAPALHAAVPGWVRQAAATPVPAQPASTKAVVLLDEKTITVSGEVTTRHRRVLKVLAPAGRKLAYTASYFGKRDKILSMRGWVLDAKGAEHELRERAAAEASATTFELYSDTRVKVLDGEEKADVGSIVAFETEERTLPYEERVLWRFQETIPVLRARLELVTSAPYETTWVRWPDVGTGFSPSRDGLKPVSTWELRDIPAIAEETRAPSSAALAGRMGIAWGPRRTWSDVARWFAGLASTQLAPTPELAAKSKELGDVRACARFAQLDVRYVAVEIGIGGYQPHTAAEIFRNRFGDCKDKATLLRAMLKERGIQSHYVLVHTTRGMTEPSFPTIAAFNHVITAIRDGGKLLFFDPTSTTTPFGLLPSYLQGSRGLLVTDDGGELIELPVHPPESSELRRVAKLKLDEQGVLRGTIEETRTGSMAGDLRGMLQPLNAADRVRYVEHSIANHLGNHTTSDVTLEQFDDPSVPLVVRYSIVASDYAKHVADMLLVRPRVVGAKGESPVDTARRYPYETDGVSLHTDDIEIAMPAGATLDELPKPVRITTPHLEYTSESTFENGVLRYRRRYAMKTLSVPPAEVAALNEASAKIAADERASAVFK
jgi:transglutaminase-like putative cysteine protease